MSFESSTFRTVVIFSYFLAFSITSPASGSPTPKLVEWKEVGFEFVAALVNAGGGEAAIAMGLVQAELGQRGLELRPVKMVVQNPYWYQIDVTPRQFSVIDNNGDSHEIGEFLVKEANGQWNKMSSIKLLSFGSTLEVYALYGAPKGTVGQKMLVK